jgi:protein TonB
VLEVMLVNTKTKAQPKNADVFAQANLDRGGNTNEERLMKSALPSTQQPRLNNVISATLQNKSAPQTSQDDHAPNAEENEQKRLAALEKQAQELMIQLKSAAKVKTKSEADETNTSAENKKVSMDEVNQALLEMNRLEALIAKQQEEYQKRPKRKFIGARATEYRYAMYVDAWRQKIEKIGNKNYPAAAKKLKLYGQLQMTVSIKKDGTIENIELNRSSGHKVLDEAARHIVELGAPYAKFSEDIRKDTDILSITRTWTFTREASLSTQQ